MDHSRPGAVAKFERLELEAVRAWNVIAVICGLKTACLDGAASPNARSGFKNELSVWVFSSTFSESLDWIPFRRCRLDHPFVNFVPNTDPN
jgi:hypothetical protein